MLFDTHTHIYLPEFDDDRDNVVRRAQENGVSQMMLPNVDVDTLMALRRSLRDYPSMCIAAMGLHPTSVDENYIQQLDHIAEQFSTDTYHAVGEIGIDLYWDQHYIREQIDVFETQLRWAAERKLPIIIHARKALDVIFQSLHKLSYLSLRGVFHCFEGSAADLSQILDLGDFFIGINGVITFKTNPLRHILPNIPTDRIVLETDAPYLTPVPLRGKRNEPAFIRHTAEFVAKELHLSEAEIEQMTYRNACRLFEVLAV